MVKVKSSDFLLAYRFIFLLAFEGYEVFYRSPARFDDSAKSLVFSPIYHAGSPRTGERQPIKFDPVVLIPLINITLADNLETRVHSLLSNVLGFARLQQLLLVHVDSFSWLKLFREAHACVPTAARTGENGRKFNT